MGDSMDNPGAEFVRVSRQLLVRDLSPRVEECLARLSDEDLWWRPNDASNSIGNLILHLCGNVRQWIVSGVGGAPDDRERQLEFAERRELTGKELLERLETTLTSAAHVLDGVRTEALLERRLIQGNDVSVLEAIYHVVEHFSMHTGQIIYVAKLRLGQDLEFYRLEGGLPRPQWRGRDA
jgi:uncharacterized damage-inducible protein DinB